MSIIVDAVFTIILAISGTDGTNLTSAAFTFPNRAACQSFRGERIDYVKDLPAADKADKSYYISDCTAVPVQGVK